MTDVSHEQLHHEIAGVDRKVAVLQSEGRGRDRRIKDVADDVATVREQMAEGRAKFAEIGRDISHMDKTLTEIGGALKTLTSDRDQRAGERNAWHRICNSKLLLAALGGLGTLAAGALSWLAGIWNGS